MIYNTLRSGMRMLLCCKKNIEKELKHTSNSIISADNMTGEFVKLSLRSEDFMKIYIIYLQLSNIFCNFALEKCRFMLAQLIHTRLLFVTAYQCTSH